MLTDEDKKMLIDFFASKVDLKEGLNKLREDIRSDFSNLQKSVDAYAKRADDYFQEMVMLSHKVDRHERWLQVIADKIGIKLEY